MINQCQQVASTWLPMNESKWVIWFCNETIKWVLGARATPRHHVWAKVTLIWMRVGKSNIEIEQESSDLWVRKVGVILLFCARARVYVDNFTWIWHKQRIVRTFRFFFKIGLFDIFCLIFESFVYRTQSIERKILFFKYGFFLASSLYFKTVPFY